MKPLGRKHTTGPAGHQKCPVCHPAPDEMKSGKALERRRAAREVDSALADGDPLDACQIGTCEVCNPAPMTPESLGHFLAVNFDVTESYDGPFVWQLATALQAAWAELKWRRAEREQDENHSLALEYASQLGIAERKLREARIGAARIRAAASILVSAPLPTDEPARTVEFERRVQAATRALREETEWR